jgi:hypothetical protein
VPAVSSVTVSPAAPNVGKGGNQTFTAAVQGTNNPAQTVTWSVEGGGQGTAIGRDSGFLTVAADESAATLTVRAVSVVDASKSGTATVTVTGGSAPTVSSVIVSPSAVSIEQGGNKTFTAVVQGTNNPAQTVTWSVEGGGEGTAIGRDSGVLTVAADERAASLTIRAVSTVDPGKSGTAAVTVTGGNPITVTGVTVNPAIVSVEQGGNKTFTAVVQGTNNPAQTVTWSVEGGGQGTAIGRDTGVLTVAADEAAATLTVRAVSTFDTGKSGTASVTITSPALPAPIVSWVTVSPTDAGVEQGGTHLFTATVEGTNDPAQTVTWSVEGAYGAGTAIGRDSGFLTVAADETAATLTVRATSTVDTTKSGRVDVIVIPVGKRSFILVYPADKAAGELSGLTAITPNAPLTLTTNAVFDTYRWQIDGFVKGTAKTFTLNAGDYSPGRHQISLEVTLNGAAYSKSGAFTVQK